MMPRLRVLILSGCYLPGFRAGGPIRSLANLVAALGADVDFRIITLDTDVGCAAAYPTVRSGAWQSVGPAAVLYLSRKSVTMRSLLREIRGVDPDLIYLNGLFEPDFTVRLLVARRLGLVPRVPVMLAPRGDCSPGALQLKRFKKAAYLRVARWAGLYRHLTWQASSDLEAADIRRLMRPPAAAVQVAPVLTDEAGDVPAGPRQPGVLRVCFLSRISPMKNLDFALRVLAGVRVSLVFTIYGPRENPAYWVECARLMDELPGHVTAVWAGDVAPEAVRATVAQHDLFFLPTRGENFGHVIFEALSAGVPVLTSDRTPWRDLEVHGAGWNHSLDEPSTFLRTIETEAVRLLEDREGFAARATRYVAMRLDRPAAVQRMRDLLWSVAGR